MSLKYCRLNGKILVLGNILRFFHLKETLSTSKMFQVKEVVSWIVMGNKQWHNADLTLIWKVKVLLSPKIPVLKSYKCFTSMPSSNLHVIQVYVLEVLKDVLPVHYHPICLKFERNVSNTGTWSLKNALLVHCHPISLLCSSSNDRKEIL